jgi:hypothetical protein
MGGKVAVRLMVRTYSNCYTDSSSEPHLQALLSVELLVRHSSMRAAEQTVRQLEALVRGMLNLQ